MKISLLRHASAEDREPDGGDRPDRKLVKKGRKQLDALGARLLSAELRFDVVLASPYTRAQQTAARLLKAMGGGPDIETVSSLDPTHSVDQALAALSNHEGSSILVVGHEPLLSQMAARLLGADELDIRLRKAGLIELEVISTDPLRAALLGLIRPRHLR